MIWTGPQDLSYLDFERSRGISKSMNYDNLHLITELKYHVISAALGATVGLIHRLLQKTRAFRN